MASAEEEVRVDLPAVGLCWGKARDPFRWLLGESVEDRRRAEERQAEGIGPGGSGASDNAVVLPGKGSHALASQFIYGHSGPLRISGSVPDHQLEWSSGDPAGVIDLVNGELESGEQVPARIDPAWAGQWDEGADLDCRFLSHQAVTLPCRRSLECSFIRSATGPPLPAQPVSRRASILDQRAIH